METIKVKPGIYHNVTYDDYFLWEAVNNSSLWQMKKRSPAFYRYAQENKRIESDAFRVGGALHFMLLEPDVFVNHYAVAPKVDRRTKDGKATWAEFQESLKGRQHLTKEEHDMVVGMVEAVKRDKVYQFVTGGTAEMGIVWNDEETGVLCKAKLDYVLDGKTVDVNGTEIEGARIITDIKSTAVDGSAGGFKSAEATAFRRSLETYGYYQQAAFYADGLQALTGDTYAFLFLAIEKELPYLCATYDCSERLLAVGRASYRAGLRTIKRCMDTGVWPSYNDGRVEQIDVSTWLAKEELGDEALSY